MALPQKQLGDLEELVLLAVLRLGDQAYGASIREELEARNFNVIELRMCEMRDNDLRDELELADLILVGTATINRDAPPQAWHALSLFSLVTPKAKIAAAFGSFGWSGEAVKLVEERLKGLRFKLPVPGLTLRFAPTEDNIRECKEFASQLASQVLGTEAA